MIGKRWLSAGLVVLLFAMNGCFSCSSSGGGGSSDDDGFTIPIDGNPLFNGLTCETTESSWRCQAEDGTSLDFAIYFFTFRGIAVMTTPQGSPNPVAFSWVQRSPTRVDITTDDNETLIADDIDGSTAERFLSFALSGAEEPTRSFTCTLDVENVLDQDCDEKADGLPTSTPVPTATATPTATSTPELDGAA
jgi:hypothetical protein